MEIALGEVRPISEPPRQDERRGWGIGRKRLWGCVVPTLLAAVILGGLLASAVRHARNAARRAQDT